jgi:outer membrane protein assembly factor BamB
VHSKTRIDVGALFSASPVVVEGRLHCLSEDGDMYVVKTGPEYELLAKNSLNEVCMASPAVSDGKWFIRSFKHLYCIQQVLKQR